MRAALSSEQSGSYARRETALQSFTRRRHRAVPMCPKRPFANGVTSATTSNLRPRWLRHSFGGGTGTPAAANTSAGPPSSDSRRHRTSCGNGRIIQSRRVATSQFAKYVPLTVTGASTSRRLNTGPGCPNQGDMSSAHTGRYALAVLYDPQVYRGSSAIRHDWTEVDLPLLPMHVEVCGPWVEPRGDGGTER